MKATIVDGTVNVVLTDIQEERMLQLAAEKYAWAKAEQEAIEKTYEVNAELEKRLKMCKDSIWDAIREGRLKATCTGNKKGYRVTELACRKFLGDI